VGGERAIEIAETSQEYIRVAASATAGIDGSPIDVATAPKLAFLIGSDNPDDDEWHTAEWDDGFARIMLGPDEVPLAVGTYWVWISFTAGAERPVERAGQLRVF
jgi:hypothetical protein